MGGTFLSLGDRPGELLLSQSRPGLEGPPRRLLNYPKPAQSLPSSLCPRSPLALNSFLQAAEPTLNSRGKPHSPEPSSQPSSPLPTAGTLRCRWLRAVCPARGRCGGSSPIAARPRGAREEPGAGGSTSVTLFLLGSAPVCAAPPPRPLAGGDSPVPRGRGGAREPLGGGIARAPGEPGALSRPDSLRAPSGGIWFALGRSAGVFRNKTTHPEGKAGDQLRFRVLGVQSSGSVGMRWLWRGCGSSTCPGVRLPPPLSLFVSSRI